MYIVHTILSGFNFNAMIRVYIEEYISSWAKCSEASFAKAVQNSFNSSFFAVPFSKKKIVAPDETITFQNTDKTTFMIWHMKVWNKQYALTENARLPHSLHG